jgi:hypothetical protein
MDHIQCWTIFKTIPLHCSLILRLHTCDILKVDIFQTGWTGYHCPNSFNLELYRDWFHQQLRWSINGNLQGNNSPFLSKPVWNCYPVNVLHYVS